MVGRAAIAWLGLLVLAVLNGGLREAILVEQLGSVHAHIVSTALLCLVIGIFAWLVVGWMYPRTAGDALGAGLLWLVLTLLFEFAFGRFVAGMTWSELFAAYNLFEGSVWVFVPLVVLFAPYAAGRIRRLL